MVPYLAIAAALADPLPLIPDDVASAVMESRFEVGRQTVYRQQISTQLSGVGPFVQIDGQRTVTVKVQRRTSSGASQVRVATETPVSRNVVQGFGATLDPVPERVVTWLVDPQGTWQVIQGPDPGAQVDELLSGLAPTAGGFGLPSQEISVGHTWEVPVEVDVEATTEGPQGDPETTRLRLAGASTWRFAGWAMVDGQRCAVLSEAQELAGTSHTMGPEQTTRALTGIASSRTSHVCWDVSRGEVHWQQAVSRAVLHDRVGGSLLRLRMQVVAGRVASR